MQEESGAREEPVYDTPLPRLPPLVIAVPSVAASQSTEDWNENELRDFLRDILIKKQGVEETVDDIMALLTKFELPQDPMEIETGDKMLTVRSGKGFIMNRYLANIPKGSDAWTLADSGFSSNPQASELRDIATYQSPMDGEPLIPSAPSYRETMLGGWIPPFHTQSPTLGPSTADLISKEQSKHSLVPQDFYPGASDMRSAIDGDANIEQQSLSNELALESPRPCPHAYQGGSLKSLLTLTLSDDVTSSDSNITEENNLLTLALGDRANEVVERLLGFFERLITSKLGIFSCQNNQNGQNSDRSNGDCPAQLSASLSTSTFRRNKRPQRDNDSDGGPKRSGDEDEKENPRRKRLKGEDDSKPKIACPYIKRFPVEFSTWRTCIGPGFDGINRMKYIPLRQKW